MKSSDHMSERYDIDDVLLHCPFVPAMSHPFLTF